MKPKPRSKETKFNRRVEAWLTNAPVVDDRAKVEQPQLDHWEAVLEVGGKSKPKKAKHLSGEHPVRDMLRVVLKAPGLSQTDIISSIGNALNRGMTIDTATGIQVNRCIFVILSSDVDASSETMFAEVLQDCRMYLQRVDDLTNEIAFLAVSAVVEEERKLTDLAANMQP